MRRSGAVHAHDGPTIRHRACSGFSYVNHRLYGDRKPRLKSLPVFRLPVVGNLWIFVEADADAMPDKIAHDAESGGFDNALHGRADVAEEIIRRGRFDSRRERIPRDIEQLLRLRVDLPHGD